MKRMVLLTALCGGIALAGGGLLWWRIFMAHPVNPPLPTQQIVINDQRISVEIANTTTTRSNGLSNREQLTPGTGMLFIFPQASTYAFWMKDMRFALDIVWIRDGIVIDITHDVPAPAPNTSILNLATYAPREAANMVLELNAGGTRSLGIEIGQSAHLEI